MSDKEKVLELIGDVRRRVENEDIHFVQVYSSHSFGLSNHEFTFYVNTAEEEYKRGYIDAINDMKGKLEDL